MQASLPPAKDADLEVEGKAGADDDGLPKTTTTAEGAPIEDKTALEWAKKRGYHAIVALLEE